jgi:hypothetical protein
MLGMSLEECVWHQAGLRHDSLSGDALVGGEIKAAQVGQLSQCVIAGEGARHVGSSKGAELQQQPVPAEPEQDTLVRS